MAQDDLILLPQPRQITRGDGTLRLDDQRLIVLDTAEPQALRYATTYLQNTLQTYAQTRWSISASDLVPHANRGVHIAVVPGGMNHDQGYELEIAPQHITVVASTAQGAWYGVLTLCQIIQLRGRELPLLRIRDWPDFAVRGVMLDISRDKVPTMETLRRLIDLLASWKINQLQLYTEHTFAYHQHPQVWADASPITGEEILHLDAYSRERGVELVPNQNSFGHMHRWLTLDQYRPLAEVPQGSYTTRWGQYNEPFSLCPSDPGSLALVRELFDELLPHFTSQLFNVGCDETIDLGCGRSQAAVDEHGAGRVYLDFLTAVYREVKARGRIMQFWGDIIMEYPELVPELPRDAIALEWGYEADHPFDEHGKRFADSGIPFYVCPGTSTWNTIAGRTDNALANLQNAARNGLDHGAVGFLNTDWGDNGHWQPLPISYLGFAYGAAIAWDQAANHDLDLAAALNHHAFHDPSGILGRIAVDLGNAYKQVGTEPFNASPLFIIAQLAPETLKGMLQGADEETVCRPLPNRVRVSPRRIAELHDLRPEGLQHAREYVDQVMAHLAEAQPQGDDRDLIRREFAWAADMLRHACARGAWMIESIDGARPEQQRTLADDAQGLLAEYRSIWMARNRSGGLADSMARLEAMQHDYDA